MCASGDLTLCSPVDTPTNGKGAGEGEDLARVTQLPLKPLKCVPNSTILHTKKLCMRKKAYVGGFSILNLVLCNTNCVKQLEEEGLA